MSDIERIELTDIAAANLERFEREERILSFQQYFGKLQEHPELLARNSAQYLADALAHFGTRQIGRPLGSTERYRAFDGGDDVGGEQVIGNERAQAQLIKVLSSFRREGRINRLMVVHGPNGSAKTSFVDALFRALEAYSRSEEGAVYRFNWVFPVRESAGGPIGFGGYRTDPDSEGSFAFLDEDEIDAKLPSEHNDNPLFLLPEEERARLFKAAESHAEWFEVSETIRNGDLGHRSRKVLDALMNAYRGDLGRVLRHVQVERLFFSRRYRRGAVTVEPQMRIDAGVRQLTVDRSLSSLPKVLQSQTLFEVSGPLVEGNRGLIEFNDFLKRPMEANKYLLATGEKGTVSLENRTIHLDSVLIATANENYLEGLKQQPDWSSYRGRLELIRMGYLLDYRDEAKIYDLLLESIRVEKPVAPRTTQMLGLWAVMTRLQKPNPDPFDKRIRRVIQRMTPLEKALLYADGQLPEKLDPDEKQLLRASISDIHEQGYESTFYEGRVGASPRELKQILLEEVHADGPTLSPFGVFERLESLTRDPSMFEWLRIEPVGDFHRPQHFIEVVKEYYLDGCEREIRIATGLVEERAHISLFDRYVRHVTAFLRNERIKDPVTDSMMDPDQGFMREMEGRMDVGDSATEFRSNVLSRVAAFRIENPTEMVDFESIFPDLIELIERAYFKTKQVEIEQVWADLLAHYDEELGDVSADRLAAVETAHNTLVERFGYTVETAREIVGLLRSERASTAALRPFGRKANVTLT